MLYLLFVICGVIVAYWKSVKNKPFAIVLIVCFVFGYIFINKKDQHYNVYQASAYQNNSVNSRYSSNINNTYSSEYYGHSTECTAICWDGTCSKSLGRRGVCSRHGGVKHWLR